MRTKVELKRGGGKQSLAFGLVMLRGSRKRGFAFPLVMLGCFILCLILMFVTFAPLVSASRTYPAGEFAPPVPKRQTKATEAGSADFEEEIRQLEKELEGEKKALFKKQTKREVSLEEKLRVKMEEGEEQVATANSRLAQKALATEAGTASVVNSQKKTGRESGKAEGEQESEGGKSSSKDSHAVLSLLGERKGEFILLLYLLSFLLQVLLLLSAIWKRGEKTRKREKKRA